MLQAVKKFLRPDDPSIDTAAAKLWHKQYKLTPDLWYLEQHVRQLIFIPDDLKYGKPNHKLIEDHIPIQPDCYTLQNYTMYNKDLGEHSFPLPFEEGIDFGIHGWYKPELARIKGELYALPSDLFWKVLDIHKQNTVQFIRRRVSITMPYRILSYKTGPEAETWEKIPVISKDHLRTCRAWMYEANPEYWSDYIGVSLGTRAVPLYEHNTPKVWIEKYYKF